MKALSILLISVILISGCAVPSPITKLTPSTVENRDYWNMGQQFVYASDYNVWFDCAFNRIENNMLIFDVKVTNQSDTLVLVDPAEFAQQVYINDTLLVAQRNANDPEAVLLNLNIKENIAAAEAKNAATVGIISAVLLTGAVVAVAVSDNNNNHHRHNNHNNAEAAITTAIVADGVAQTASSSAEEANVRANNNWTYRKSLAESFLRKTTLRKGFYIDGEVHFPYFPNAKWYRLIFTSGKAKADFLFKQQLIYPVATYNNANNQ
jgi:hypothetical protein